MRCKLCESATEHFGELRILGSFDARYRRCTVCGFVYVEEATASNGSNFHVFSTIRFSKRLLRTISSRRSKALARAFVRLTGRTRSSLTHSDAEKARLALPAFE